MIESSLVGPLKSVVNTLASLANSYQLLFDLPGVVDDIGRVAADRVVKLHQSVGDRSRDTLIFPRTTHQIMVFVIKGREKSHAKRIR